MLLIVFLLIHRSIHVTIRETSYIKGFCEDFNLIVVGISEIRNKIFHVDPNRTRRGKNPT